MNPAENARDRVVTHVAHRIDVGDHATTNNKQRISTDDHIVAEAAVHRVVAAAPIERIVEIIPGDDLGAVRAGDILDAPQHIGFNDCGLNDAARNAGRPQASVAAVGRAEPEADNIRSHNRNVIRVVTEVAGGIDAGAADQTHRCRTRHRACHYRRAHRACSRVRCRKWSLPAVVPMTFSMLINASTETCVMIGPRGVDTKPNSAPDPMAPLRPSCTTTRSAVSRKAGASSKKWSAE